MPNFVFVDQWAQLTPFGALTPRVDHDISIQKVHLFPFIILS